MLATNRVPAKAIMKLFQHWELSQEAQCSLLGIRFPNHNRLKYMKKGLIGIPTGRDSHDRVGHLLGIHKALRLLYRKNPELLYGWVRMRNRQFNGCTPLEIMIKDGYLGISKVHNYLNTTVAK